MLTRTARSRLAVVLVGARNPQNIGAVARAMQDFGFIDLRVVNDFGAPFEAAQLEATSAVGASDVMRAAQRFSSLPDALADCTLVAGTTAIGSRGLRQPVFSLRDASTQILEALASGEAPDPPRVLPSDDLSRDPSTASLVQSAGSRIALLFGSEKTGLTNEQLSHCSLLLTIPLFTPEGRHLSMNLGQAVAVCLYELGRAGFEGSRELPVLHAVSASAQDRERLTALVLETMEKSGYNRRFPANSRPEIVRQLANALGNSRDEAATWMGLLKCITRAMDSSSTES